jgi:transposase-like protein
VTPTTGTTDETCPYCRATSGVQSTPAPPRVQAWSCTACRTDWAITIVNPQPYFYRLAATIEQLSATRSVLRQLIRLSGDAPGLTDEQLRARLVVLADRTRLV